MGNPLLQPCALLPPLNVLQADDVPDDAEEAGEDADLELEGSRSIAEQQHADAPPQ